MELTADMASVFEGIPYDHNVQTWVQLSSLADKAVFRAVRDMYTPAEFNRDPHAALFSAAAAMHNGAAWAHYGYNVFRLGHNFTALLLLTDVERGRPHLPFPTFKVSFPERVFYEPDNTTVFLRCMFVHHFTAHSHPWLGCHFVFSDETERDVYYNWELLGTEEEHTAPTLDPWEVLSEPLARAALTVVRGLCSFLEAKIEPLELDNAKAVERAKWTKKPTPRVFTVERTVKLSQEIRRAAQVVVAGETDPLWKLQNRHVVRGHWRWQPIGHRLPEGVEGPQNAKKTWIEPYWKGPEGAEAWRHVYEVGEPS